MDSEERIRIAGKWWEFEPYRELRRRPGIKKPAVHEMPSLGEAIAHGTSVLYPEDPKAEKTDRLTKLRDEKVARACGYVHEPRLAGYKTPQTRRFAALHILSGYAYGRGAMLAEEAAAYAARSGASAALIADPFSLSGAAEFDQIARSLSVKPLLGATFELDEGGEIVLVARTQKGWRSLSRLITECHLSEPRLFPLATWERLAHHTDDLICLSGGAGSPIDHALARRKHDHAKETLDRLIHLYGRDHTFLQVERTFLPGRRAVEAGLIELAERTGVQLIAGGPITHAEHAHFPVQDVLTCIHHLIEIDDFEPRKPSRAEGQPEGFALPRRALNAERTFRTYPQLAEVYADQPDWVAATMRVADLVDDSVLPPRSELPPFAADEDDLLREQVYAGMRRLRPLADAAFRRRMNHELLRIQKLGFSRHFLVAWDMCREAREQGIHFSARGSVVDSVVSFLLGFSRIDAHEHRLHFDRFLPADGSKRPDIDIDFEAGRREDVRQYLVTKYGNDHVATVGAVGAYCSRGIIREVGKVLGIPEEQIKFLAKRIHGGVSPDRLERALESRPELRQSNIDPERYRWVFRLAERMMDIPRNLRSHPSGVVVSREPVCDFVPVTHSAIEAVKIMQWDKRSAKRCFDKFDILCLRGQDVLSGTEEAIRRQELDFCVETAPWDVPETYAAMRSGELIGIPQSASPAMRQAHIRIKTENLRDASLVQAGIRPGVGGAVKINELIARRRGKPFTFDHPALRDILGETYGIVVFQEQVDLLLQRFGGYTSGESEDIRESIYKKRREDFAAQIKTQVVRKIVDNGFAQGVAEQVYDLVAGFNGYGFAQGHALAFAEISLRCIWLQQHFPAEYFASLLNAQPAGYYGPATIANEARLRGVKVLGVDVSRSEVKFSVEDVRAESDPQVVLPNAGIRVGLAQVSGLSVATQQRIVREQPFTSFFDFVARVRPARDELEALILCGGFDSLFPNRRALLWNLNRADDYANTLAGLNEGTLPLEFPAPALMDSVADFTQKERAIYDRKFLGLDIEHHLVAFERARVLSRGGLTADQVKRLPPGQRAFVVGNPIRLRFPPTRTGKRVVFFDLEDETGLLNVTCFDETYQRYGAAIVCSPYSTVMGVVQDRDGHPAFLAERVYPYRPVLRDSLQPGQELPLKVADFLVG
ncbi:MAG: DNA polymerase III subunit alpha [Armatimonadetes bacterium]|nr:DNA polymerase III subunit alpha [Armatimonadota bacterium]